VSFEDSSSASSDDMIVGSDVEVLDERNNTANKVQRNADESPPSVPTAVMLGLRLMLKQKDGEIASLKEKLNKKTRTTTVELTSGNHAAIADDQCKCSTTRTAYNRCCMLCSSCFTRHQSAIDDLEKEKTEHKKTCTEMRRLRGKQTNLQKLHISVKRQVKKLKKTLSKKEEVTPQPKNKVTALKVTLNEVCGLLEEISKEKKSEKTFRQNAKLVVHALWDCAHLHGFLKDEFMMMGKSMLRKEIFSPDKILRIMDLHGGTLSYEGLKVLRQLETDGQKWVRNTVIPSTAELQRAAIVVQHYGSLICPYTIKKMPGELDGECISFSPEDVLRLALRACGLEDSARNRSILVSEAIDGAVFTNLIGHVMFWIKITDFFARDPITGKIGICQSRNNAFPIDIIIGKETKELMHGHFGEYFRELIHLCEVVFPERYGTKPINLAANMDLSAKQKCVKRGGGN
jgi:hypothetical protein